MRIKIAERLRPFSHHPGIYCLLPGTTLRFQIFPTRILVHDLRFYEPHQVKDVDLQLTGPVRNFTVQQDLEKGLIHVWGHYQEGYVRYAILALTASIAFSMKKCPRAGVKVGDERLHQNDICAAFSSRDFIFPAAHRNFARLSLGCHKAQEWELVARRADMKEVLPFWHRLGSMAPKTFFSEYQGTLNLLKICRDILHQGKKESVLPSFFNLFQAGFEGILSPRLIDTQYQGLKTKALSSCFIGSPLALLTEGAKLISQMFFKISDSGIHVLPDLSPEFHCGRMIGIECKDLGEIDMEWTKKTLRRMVFRSSRSGEVPFHFGKKLKTYRLRCSLKDRGKRCSVRDPLLCRSGGAYFLDRFEK